MSEQTEKITLDESNLSDATKKEYLFRVGKFYQYAPIKSDDELIDCPTDELQGILVNYARHLVKRVNLDDLSSNTVPKMFRGIRWLLNSNYRENDIKWKPIEALFPKSVKRSGYKAWSTSQVELMINKTADTRNKAVIHFQASVGDRIGVHDHPLLMKHLVMMQWENQGCYAVLLYADEDETVEEKDLRDKQDNVQGGDSYWAFLTPEATDILDRYFSERKNGGESFTSDTPIFLKDESKQLLPSIQMTSSSVGSMIYKIVNKDQELKRIKKGRRYDIQLNHGFRKRTNTILKLESEVNSNIAEKIMGHKNGLDGVYLAPTRQQCFNEFVKGILQLTIDGTKRKGIELENERREKTQLEKEIQHNKTLKNDMEKIKLQQDNDAKKLTKKINEIKTLEEKMNNLENFKEEMKQEFQDLIKGLPGKK